MCVRTDTYSFTPHTPARRLRYHADRGCKVLPQDLSQAIAQQKHIRILLMALCSLGWGSWVRNFWVKEFTVLRKRTCFTGHSRTNRMPVEVLVSPSDRNPKHQT